MLKIAQSYKHHVERIAQDLDGCEPEVCLAVRLPSQRLPTPSASEKEGEDEDDSELDAFLSSHGFEYIDAIEQPSRSKEDTDNDDWSEGIQHANQSAYFSNLRTQYFRHTWAFTRSGRA